ncbi:hypothetical protein [Spiroplasma endosymbiont of Aspidapion aeneum]|uniref:hypothetical protein n=1 Tax=Spiroplasma endosymbiont of Aspidapion aeneum TaxID=3066276 RepID=UPI00313BD5E7
MFREIKKIFKILFINYISDLLGLYTGWAIIILTLFAWLFFKDTYGVSETYDAFVTASAIGVCCVRISLYNFARTIFIFKNDNIFDRWIFSGVKKISIALAFIIFNFILCTLLSLTLIAISSCFESQRYSIRDMNVPVFLLGYIMMVFTCQLIGFIAGMYIFNSYEWVVTFGLFNYFVSIYLLGLGIPYNILEQYRFLYWIGYLLIQRPAIMLMDVGWVNAENMQFTYNNITHSFGYGENIYYLLANLFIFIIILLGALIFLNIWKYSFKQKESLLFINEYLQKLRHDLDFLESKQEIKEYLKNHSITNRLHNNKKATNNVKRK